MFEKDSHCSYCGRRFAQDQPWPRHCAGCDNLTYRNPLPVAVVLLPVDDGLLLIRRGIEPQKGQLALPGGYVNLGESWQEAGARELYEETGILIRPSEIQDVRTLSSPTGVLVVFGVARRRSAKRLPAFTPTDETTEWVITTRPKQLAFALHTRVVKEFFRSRT
jgi:ADP-ribose pyrophosphatase YjhB (NUDIX family)